MVGMLENVVAAWKEPISRIGDWSVLVKNIQPKRTVCGPVYEISNLVDRPQECLAIADMRAVQVAYPHYHTQGEIYFVLQGTGVTVVGSEEIMLAPGVIVMIPPITAHFTIVYADLVLAVVNSPPYVTGCTIELMESDPTVKFDRVQFDKWYGLSKKIEL